MSTATFERECAEEIEAMGKDAELARMSKEWLLASCKHKYGYHFSWMGRPVIQLPTDLMMMQELIWKIRPDVVVETGIAHGGSLIFYASMLSLLNNNGFVIGIDIDIRPHNRKEIESHPMYSHIVMVEGSSVDNNVFQSVRERASGKKVLVCLDSLHTHEHVLQELRLYSSLVSFGSYVVVFDTTIEYFPQPGNRPWGPGNNPHTAIQTFLAETDAFEADSAIDAKLQISAAPGGYLKKIR